MESELKKLNQSLQIQLNHPNTQIIETQNQGIRANGLRHPHA